MSLDEKEVKEAVDLVHEYGCIKAIDGGEENQGLIDAFQTLIDLAQLYLSIAGKMPEKKEMPDFPSTQKEQSKAQWDDGFNQARQECILAFMKALPTEIEFNEFVLRGNYSSEYKQATIVIFRDFLKQNNLLKKESTK